MPNQTRKKGKHFDFYDREKIQAGLRNRKSFRVIADEIGCTPEAVSREIQLHRYIKPSNTDKIFRPNYCKYRDTCRRKNVCNKLQKHKCKISCRKCPSCNKLCPDFVYEPCKVVNKAPYVCNGCNKRSCMFDRYLYYAPQAQKEYEQKLVLSRIGVNATKEEMIALDEIVSPLLLKGQPLSHIYEAHKDEMPCSLRSLYNYINQGCFTAKRMDLRRAVRYKRRIKREQLPRKKAEPLSRLGHKYCDFQKYMKEHPHVRIVEMDTVESIKGGKLLQTFLFRDWNLSLAYLINSKEIKNTVNVVNIIEQALGEELFKEMFPVILTDNGVEFSDPRLFELNSEGKERTKIFYCEPRHSEQKGKLEKNHEFIRYVLPKGASFELLTQEKVLLMMNHINSTKRKSLEGKTPYEAALQDIGSSALEKLGLKKVHCDAVHLTPKLLK